LFNGAEQIAAVTKWSDPAVLQRVREWAMPALDAHSAEETGYYWIDGTGFPKKGRHSAGVARQYCGQLGKQDNCQVAVSLSIATRQLADCLVVVCPEGID
jgi:SRSO17 transposase